VNEIVDPFVPVAVQAPLVLDESTLNVTGLVDAHRLP